LTSARWTFEWLTSWDEIWSEPFLAQWHEWMETSPTAHVFFHPALVRAWVETYLPLHRMEPRFLVATRDDCTVFLPMVLWRRNWKNAFQRLLIPVGYSDYDYHDPIVVGDKDNRVLESFWRQLLVMVSKDLGSEYDAMQLGGIREAAACSGRFFEERDLCPWCDLSGLVDGESFLRSLNKSLRGDIRRQERRMNETGSIGYHVFGNEDVLAATESLDGLLHAHSQRWPQAYKASGFHANLIRLGLKAGVTHFSMLRVGERIVAWHLGFVYGSRFYYYMPAHEAEYARLSPGKILLYYCIRDAIEKGLMLFDHLRGEESYKAGWTNHANRLYRLQVAGSSIGATLRNLAVDRLKPAVCQAARSWRGG